MDLLYLSFLLSACLVASTAQFLNSFNSKNTLLHHPVKKVSAENFKGRAVEKPLFIGAFNVQTLGKKKLSDDSIMVNLEKIVHRYDLILITELMTNNMRLIDRFLSNVNNFAPEGVVYNLTMNNDTTVNEYCAFLYRIDKLRVLKVDSYEDRSKFYRTPYFVLFQSPTLRDMQQFGAIGYHVKPDQAVREIDALAEVYDFMSMKYKIEDILLMGDFNADCTYVKENDWDKISLWTRGEFTWPIGSHVDTTTNYKSCALDRFVYAGNKMNAGVILSSARSLDMREEFGLSLSEIRALSDHKPIELKIRGKLSITSEKHLSSDVCFTITDSRTPNITFFQIMDAAKASNFSVEVSSSNTILIKNETKYMGSMLRALKMLRNTIPILFSTEHLEAILYKLEGGVLDDTSSYADIQKETFKINYEIYEDRCTIIICKTSTIN